LKNWFTVNAFQEKYTEMNPDYVLRLLCPAPTVEIPPLVTLRSDKKEVKVGRDRAKVDVYLDSTRVPNMISRTHAVLSWCDNIKKWQIKDNNSVNGVFVNDIKIKEHYLNSKEKITFGGGAKIQVGQSILQPNSEFTYLFDLALPRSNSQYVPSASERSPLKKRKERSPEIDNQEREEAQKRLKQLEGEKKSIRRA